MTKQQLQKTKPIIFDTESVRAILDGRKTAARQVIKNASPKWTFDCLCDDAAMTVIDRNGNEKPKEVDGLWATFNAHDEYIEFPMIKAKYQVGDVLYVRETWCEVPYEYEHIPIDGGHITMPKIAYRADSKVDYTGIWRPSIHMPKEAARIFLEITDVRVQRLQDITPADCHKEGVMNKICSECLQEIDCRPQSAADDFCGGFEIIIDNFAGFWNSKIPKKDLDKYGWEANPFVFVYEFKRVEVENE